MSNEAVQYLGHLPGGNPVQAHSAGPDYPGVIYGRQFEGSDTVYWGVLFDGFDYGVFHDQADASELIRKIKDVRLSHGTVRVRFERALAAHLDCRAARNGVSPVGYPGPINPGLLVEDRLSDRRPVLPVDGLRTPIVARVRWGYTSQCDAFLEAFGYNPADFQAHGVLASTDQGKRELHPHPYFI